MADVEMQDAAADATSSKTKAVSKAAKPGAADTADSKKRFEVKKVYLFDGKNAETQLT